MNLPNVEMLPLLGAGIPGLGLIMNSGGVQCETAVAAAATATATQAAVANTEHCPIYVDWSVRDDAGLVADTYVLLEIIRDDAAAGGGKVVLFTKYYAWDIDLPGQLTFINGYEWFPAPIRSGTSGETLDATITVAAAADAVCVNILSIPLAD